MYTGTRMSVRLNSPDELLLSLTVCLDVMLWHLQSYSFLLVGSTKMWKISHLFAVRLGWSVWKSVAESKHTTSSRLILCLIMKPKYIKKYLYLILPHHSISQESIVLFISLLIKKVHQGFFFFFFLMASGPQNGEFSPPEIEHELIFLNIKD